MRMRTLIVSLAATVAIFGGGGSASAGGGCMHGTVPTDGDGHVVEMIDACFTPTVLHVDPGTEVTFVNRDPMNHQVMGVGGTWGTFDELAAGDRVSYAFEEDGVYVYSCFLHPGMVGAIVAGSGTGSAGMAAAPVAGGAVTRADTAAKPPAAAPADDGSVLGALLASATVGLVLSGGLVAAALRHRRSTASLERAAG
jgi:plastocyanin